MSAYFSVDRLCSEAIVERLGWVLVHSMWQFAAVAIMAAVIAKILRRSSATARYGVLVIAMAMTVVAPCVTWIFIPASGVASALREDTVAIESQPSNASEDESIGDAKLGPTGSEIAMSLTGFEESKVVDFKIDEQTRRADAQPLAETLTNILRPWFTWIVGGWVIGVLLCSLRPLLGWRMLRRLRRVGISPPSDEVVAALQRVSQRLGIRRAVQVLHSTLATGPLVVGYLRPVVLLPVSLVTSIPMPQLEAILAHELTHIRRHDFLINLAQTLVETLFFYHPAVWWLSRQIRIEREHCCDDLVVKLLDNGVEYGRALLAIEQFQGQQNVLALGAVDGSLLGRIRRITGNTAHQPRFIPFFAAAIAVAVICGMWMAGQGFLYGASDEAKKEDSSIAEESDDSSETELRPLKADLPSGTSVELLGVTDAIQNSDGQWWNPDGTSLPASPIPWDSLDLTKKRTDGRVFAFRLTGRQAFHLPDIKVQFLKNGQPVTLLDGQKAWSESRITWNPQTRESIVEFAAGPPNDADSVNMDLRFTSDEKGVSTYDQHGQSLGEYDYGVSLLDAAVNRIFRRVHVLRAGPHNDGFAVWTKPFHSGGDDGLVMLNVYHGHASSLISNSQPDGLEQKFSLKISPRDVENFAFQFYPYDYQVRIRKVALKAGQQGEPEMTLRPIESQTIGELEARDTLTEMYRDLIEFVPAGDGLEDLHLRNLPTVGWQFLSLLTRIRAIEIQGGDLRRGSLQHIAQIPGLKSLTIVGAKCEAEDLRYLRQHATLENLNVELTTQTALADENERGQIWNYTQFREREWIETNLKRLSRQFPDEVANRHRLEAAVLTDRSIWHLDELKNLKSLRIVNSPVSGKSLRAFAKLPNLQHLKIEVIDPTTETGATLASFPSLRSFGAIEGNPDVFSQLSFSKSLEELEVSWLNDEGVDELLQMSQLKQLHLHSSEISDTGLLKLAKLSRLTELSLTVTKGTITDEGIARLRSLLPNCKVTFEKTPVAAAANSNDQKPVIEAEATGTIVLCVARRIPLNGKICHVRV